MLLIKVVDGTTCDLKDGIRRICAEGKCIQVWNLSMYTYKKSSGTDAGHYWFAKHYQA